MENRRHVQLEEKSQCCSILRGQERGPGKLLVSQPRLPHWKSNGTDPFGGPEGSSAIKVTVVYKKRNGEISP